MNSIVIYQAAGDEVTVNVGGTDRDGKPTHNKWTGKFNGRYYAVTGDPTSDQRAYRKVSSRVLSLTAKKAGKVTLTGRITVSRDGKHRTVTTTGKNSKGKWVTNTAVYDKQ